MQMNSWRGLLAEYGEVMGKSRVALDKAIPGILARLAERLPTMLTDTLREQWQGLTKLDEQIAQIEGRLRAWMKADKACQAIAGLPGVGLLTATAAVATMGQANAFRSGREFAAWLGLVPKQFGSGGKLNLLGLSKRGRHICAHAADPRRAQRAHAYETARPVDPADSQAAAIERGHRCWLTRWRG